jgi:peptidoglycan/xylan/chitin deacetylase (PgdA/CDA1 family)
MHVGSESQDVAALPEVIRRLRAEGYSFVTIPDMLAAQ